LGARRLGAVTAAEHRSLNCSALPANAAFSAHLAPFRVRPKRFLPKIFLVAFIF